MASMGRVGNSPNAANSAAMGGSRVTLRSIRALPSLDPLSTAGVELVLNALPAELELVLSKHGWKAPASAHIPTRHLCVGTQMKRTRDGIDRIELGRPTTLSTPGEHA